MILYPRFCWSCESCLGKQIMSYPWTCETNPHGATSIYPRIWKYLVGLTCCDLSQEDSSSQPIIPRYTKYGGNTINWNIFWLVVDLPLWKMMELGPLGWLFHSQLFMESHNIPWFQTTNQLETHMDHRGMKPHNLLVDCNLSW